MDFPTIKDAPNYIETNPPVSDWRYKEGTDPEMRVYYHPCDEEDSGKGFYFCTLVIIGHNPDLEMFNSDDEVELLYNGVAYFDGIRHMYASGDNGYTNYPDIRHHIEALILIQELEKKYCRDLI